MIKILTIIPYAFYPPQNGGALRCFYLLREMANHHDVTLITVQPETDFHINHELKFPNNVKVISLGATNKYRSIFNLLPERIADAINYKLLSRSLTSTNSYFLAALSPILKALEEIKPEIVYFENLESLKFFGGWVRRKIPSTLTVYDAHNVDSELWQKLAIADKNHSLVKYARNALKMEKHLSDLTNFVFACSQVDLEKLNKLNDGKLAGAVIPNGVDVAKRNFDSRKDKRLLKEIVFCGDLSTHANKEGISWFYNEVFPLLKNVKPDLKITIIGNNADLADYKTLINDNSINFEGYVESVVPFYLKASVAIVPLLTGSGTRLKILEAMSMGTPVVSTNIGAEGIGCSNDINILISDAAKGFADAIHYLLDNEIKFEEIRANAVNFVNEKYDWKLIGKEVNRMLVQLIEDK